MNPKDLRIDVYQLPTGFVGVRVTHVPSMEQVDYSGAGSAIKNKDIALGMLEVILKQKGLI